MIRQVSTIYIPSIVNPNGHGFSSSRLCSSWESNNPSVTRESYTFITVSIKRTNIWQSDIFWEYYFVDIIAGHSCWGSIIKIEVKCCSWIRCIQLSGIVSSVCNKSRSWFCCILSTWWLESVMVNIKKIITLIDIINTFSGPFGVSIKCNSLIRIHDWDRYFVWISNIC